MAKRLLYTTLGKLTEESAEHIHASFTSWKEYGFDVVIFGEPFHKPICDAFGFTLDLNYEKNEFNLPLVRNLFERGLTYEGYDLYCYLNSDIIFTNDPNPYLDQIEFEDYMAVGQRLDVWGFPDITHQDVHDPGGIDYFFHTPNFMDWSKMPDFAIARGRFDHWIMGAALETGKPVVDMTLVFMPTHPEPAVRIESDWIKNYANGNPKIGYQIYRNNYFFAKEQKHGQTDYCPFYFTPQGLEKRTKSFKNEFGKELRFNHT